jgi:hypothetical protein
MLTPVEFGAVVRRVRVEALAVVDDGADESLLAVGDTPWRAVADACCSEQCPAEHVTVRCGA